MSDTHSFQTLDAATLQADMLKLLCQVAKDKGRIEVTNCDGETCVMITKAELDSLEQALDIMFRTSGARHLEQTVERFAHIVNDGNGPAATA